MQAVGAHLLLVSLPSISPAPSDCTAHSTFNPRSHFWFLNGFAPNSSPQLPPVPIVFKESKARVICFLCNEPMTWLLKKAVWCYPQIYFGSPYKRIENHTGYGWVGGDCLQLSFFLDVGKIQYNFLVATGQNQKEGSGKLKISRQLPFLACQPALQPL